MNPRLDLHFTNMVQCTPSSYPTDLSLIKGAVQISLSCRAISQYDTLITTYAPGCLSPFRKPVQTDAVTLANLTVVGKVVKSQGQHALFEVFGYMGTGAVGDRVAVMTTSKVPVLDHLVAKT